MFCGVLQRKMTVVMAGAPPLGGEGEVHGPGALRGVPTPALWGSRVRVGVKDAARSWGSWRGEEAPLADLRPRGKGPGPISWDGAALTAVPALMPLCSGRRGREAFVWLRCCSQHGPAPGHAAGCGRGALAGCKVRPPAAAAVLRRAAGSCTPRECGLSGSYWASSVD